MEKESIENNLKEELVLVGKKIAGARRAKGYTQQLFAKKIKISYPYYQRIEAGKINVTIHTLFRIAEGLGVTVSSLFTR